jgi:hypothetical protein
VSSRGVTPAVDPRDRDAIEAAIRARIGGYVPGWQPRPGSASGALLEVFTHYLELLGGGLNQVPERSRLAFLDMLGTSLLSARSARAPLVFQLVDTAPAEVTVPKDTRVAAPAAPVPASPLTASNGGAQGAANAVVFATTQAISVTPAKLAALYSLSPADDAVADHSGTMASGFTLFEDTEGIEHTLYLGHDRHFAVSGAVTIRLSFRMAPYPAETIRQGLAIQWGYLAADGWVPLTVAEDGTAGLTRSGTTVLTSSCGPDASLESIDGHETCWLRGVLGTPLAPEGAGGTGRLPAIDLIEAQVEFASQDLHPDGAFSDTAPLDTANRFWPFGRRPALHTTFYLGSEEVFTRKNASVTITFRLYGAVSAAGSPSLDWEYHDGTDWRSLEATPGFEDGTAALTAVHGDVTFTCPEDWSPVKVNGKEGHWLRVRLGAGDYGQEMKLTVDAATGTVTLDPATFDPPVVTKVKLAYQYRTAAELLDHCLAYNAFTYADHGEACRWPRSPFEPFVPVAELLPAVHLGFDRALPAGLVSLYVHAASDPVTGDEGTAVSPYLWEYLGQRGWTELGVLDETEGFRRSGLVQLVGPADMVATAGLGGVLYRIRARLLRGSAAEATPVAGLWLNAAWATHRELVSGEILGQSDGNPEQSFDLVRAVGTVLEGEIVEVREWRGAGADWKTAVEGIDEADLRLESDPATGEVTAVWVRWQAVDHLYDSGPDDRHYVLERSQSILRFGDGAHGRIPPAGCQVVATYDSGGGVAGNVAAGAITELRAGVAYFQSVTNPVPAEGGAEAEPTPRVAERGPQRLRHRDRAVTAEDFEWLAREASPAVFRARCRPLTGPDGFAQRGWVTVVVVPDSPERQPVPTVELRRQVRDHISARCPASLASRIRVTGPAYVAVTVLAEIVPLDPGEAALVQARVRANLDAFLHPVTGGPGGLGWTFGQPVYLSQIARVVEEETDGVDYCVHLRLSVAGTLYEEAVPIGTDALVSAGDHEITLSLRDG